MIFEPGKTAQNAVDRVAVKAVEPYRLALNAEDLALVAKVFEGLLQILFRLRLAMVAPDADVLDDGSVLGLTQIGRTGQ